jgi:2-dehydro-3-deoxyphosphogluconate aldolase/(4S)-4-hydroxy-2-oxoglutarate aldolase
MGNNKLLDKILATGIFAVIRIADSRKLGKIIDALSAGGIKNIEITMTVPNAVQAISELTQSSADEIIIGAGTVTDPKNVELVIRNGAKFIVSPIWDENVFECCRRANVPFIPGCYTPTEIFRAWSAGSEIIKVFPSTSLGPCFLRDIAGPFPQIRLMPTGGVTIENVGEWVKAGAAAVGIGSNLLDKVAIEENRFETITARALRLVENYNRAKDEKLGIKSYSVK